MLVGGCAGRPVQGAVTPPTTKEATMFRTRVLTAAVALSLISAWPAPAAPVTVRVVTAARDIAPLEKLTAEKLTTRDFPRGLAPAPAGALTRVEDALGHVALRGLRRGEPVLANRIAKEVRAFTIHRPEGKADL